MVQTIGNFWISVFFQYYALCEMFLTICNSPLSHIIKLRKTKIKLLFIIREVNSDMPIYINRTNAGKNQMVRGWGERGPGLLGCLTYLVVELVEVHTNNIFWKALTMVQATTAE